MIDIHVHVCTGGYNVYVMKSFLQKSRIEKSGWCSMLVQRIFFKPHQKEKAFKKNDADRPMGKIGTSME